MELKFQNSKNEERVIANVSNIKETYQEIKKFLDDHHYKSYYTRINLGENCITFDVGSHAEFFNLYGTKEEIARVRNEFNSGEENEKV